jgi:hypothetical protein
MKNVLVLFFILTSVYIFGQTAYVSNDTNIFNGINEKPQKNISYKIQVLSSSIEDMTKFKYFLEDYKCEIEYHKSKIGKEVYRYLISPKENTLISANMLLEETTFNFQNPYIVVYFKNKRQN